MLVIVACLQFDVNANKYGIALYDSTTDPISCHSRMNCPLRPVSSTGLAIVAAIIASMMIRGALMAAGTGSFDDPDNYLPLAQSLAAGQGLALKGRPTAYRPPLYPILLAPIVTLSADRAITAIAIFHLVLGGATVGMTAVAARRWGLSRSRA